jgi:hypothetical protein
VIGVQQNAPGAKGPCFIDARLRMGGAVTSAVSADVRETLQRYCDRQGYLFTDRVKKPSSLGEKLDGGRFAA